MAWHARASRGKRAGVQGAGRAHAPLWRPRVRADIRAAWRGARPRGVAEHGTEPGPRRMIFDDTTFFSPWYWIFVATFWAIVTHFSHGVPYDVVRRAERFGGEDAEICDRLARRSLQRIETGVERYAVPGAAGTAFLIAALSTAALGAGWEPAWGLLGLVVPAAVAAAASLSEAVRIARADPPPGPERLLALLLRRRAANQFFGIMGVAFAAALFVLRHRDLILLRSDF